MVISEALKILKSELKNEREAQLLICHIAKTDMTGLILNGKRELEKAEEELLKTCIKRRKNGEPIQYITGSCEFMSLEFLVSPDVLIPRSDTETLVECLIEKIGDRKMSVIDIGTGSGCIAISLLKYCPNITVECVDITEAALSVAKKNAEKNGVLDRISFSVLDILSDLPSSKYDLAVSNPPYIRPEVIAELETEVKDFEPYTALYGGEDGLVFYKRICEISPLILNADATLAFEIGYDQGESVTELMQSLFCDVKIKKDLCGNDRVVLGTLKRT